MNALDEHSRSRTRADVAVIRHLYLDFDSDGTNAVERLKAREDVPKPNCLINTSPDHWQVSWRVQGFKKEQAEQTMRDLVREFSADPAATDCARVMRIPGFINHKRHPGYMVRMERLAASTYTPDQFPRLEHEDRRSDAVGKAAGVSGARTMPCDHLSQSELGATPNAHWPAANRPIPSSSPSPITAVARSPIHSTTPN